MEIYLVGGAVRDELLGYPFYEKDWVVVGSNSKKMHDQGYVSVGKDFPVFLHPSTKEEYALARLERKTGHGYAGFDFTAEENVTLEQDLARRDLTINAIAKDSNGKLVDPYGGKKDLENRCLRHVSDSFKEDPVRILRIARFAARYHHLGFTIAEETLELMKSMVSSGEVDYLVAERVWQECQKALSEENPQIFIDALKICGALEVVFPEINRLFGVPQPEKHHPEIDCGIHTLMSLKQASILSKKIHIRFACLTHDLGKGETPISILPQHINHEKRGLPILKSLCERLKIPNHCNELAKLVMQYHTHCHRALELNEKTLMKLLESLDAFRRPERFQEFLICCKADARGRTGYEERNYIQANYLSAAFAIANKIQARDLIQQGYSGIELGEKIRRERIKKLKVYKNNVCVQKN